MITGSPSHGWELDSVKLVRPRFHIFFKVGTECTANPARQTDSSSLDIVKNERDLALAPPNPNGLAQLYHVSKKEGVA